MSICFSGYSLLCFFPYGAALLQAAVLEGALVAKRHSQSLRPMGRSLLLYSVSVEVDSSFLAISALPPDAL